jgi:hypothetical protein
VWRALAEHWDGTSWSVVPTASLSVGAVVLTDVVAISATDAWAVGYAQDSVFEPVTEHWDGTAWTAVATPKVLSPFSVLEGVAAVTGGDVWAVGSTLDPVTGLYQALAENWDGIRWQVVPGSLKPKDGRLEAVALASDGGLWATGTAGESVVTQRVCPVQVLDSGFSVSTSEARQGVGFSWAMPESDVQNHSLTDRSGTRLFDSGLRPPGSSYVYTFCCAGTYRVQDRTTAQVSIVQVPVLVSPPAGTLDTEFAVTWASRDPPSGFLFDVQILRPLSMRWRSWLLDQADPGSVFVPDRSVGTYQFRARLTNVRRGRHSGWSPPVAITVE